MTPLRSMLFVPATGGPMLAKAFQAGADAVIVDLEDSVAVDEKAAAREALAAFLSLPGRGRPWVRVNATSTPHCLQDLEALPIAALAGIVLPKVEAPADVHVVDWVLSQLESASGLAPQSVPLLGMVETALELLSARSIVALDDERKAAMVSNLLVVLCSDHATQPVVNTGSLYS